MHNKLFQSLVWGFGGRGDFFLAGPGIKQKQRTASTALVILLALFGNLLFSSGTENTVPILLI